MSYASLFLLNYADALNNFIVVGQLTTACSEVAFDRDNRAQCSKASYTMQVYFINKES